MFVRLWTLDYKMSRCLLYKAIGYCSSAFTVCFVNPVIYMLCLEFLYLSAVCLTLHSVTIDEKYIWVAKFCSGKQWHLTQCNNKRGQLSDKYGMTFAHFTVLSMCSLEKDVSVLFLICQELKSVTDIYLYKARPGNFPTVLWKLV